MAVSLYVSFLDELAGLSFEQEIQMMEAIVSSKRIIRLSFIRYFVGSFYCNLRKSLEGVCGLRSDGIAAEGHCDNIADPA